MPENMSKDRKTEAGAIKNETTPARLAIVTGRNKLEQAEEERKNRAGSKRCKN